MIGGFGDAQGSKTDTATVSAYIAGAIVSDRFSVALLVALVPVWDAHSRSAYLRGSISARKRMSIAYLVLLPSQISTFTIFSDQRTPADCFDSPLPRQAAIGWWCWIDAVVYNGVACENTCTPAQLATCTAKSIEFAYWLPGIFALLATVMYGLVISCSKDGAHLVFWPARRINCFNYNAYAPSAAGDGGQALACNNAWLFFSFLVMFGTIIAAVWILVDGWTTHSVGCEEDKIVTIWPGIAMVIQTACMLISSVVMFIGREQGSPASSVGMF